MGTGNLCLYDLRTTRYIVWMTIPLLFLPKINIIGGFSGQTAGIRIDDFVLLFFSFLFCWAKVSIRQPLSLFEKLIGLFTLASVFSYMMNRVMVLFDYRIAEANIVYALRLFEYFFFFYVGVYAAMTINYRKVLISLTGVVVLVMLLQKAGALGAFTVSGYTQSVMYRIVGLCSFPSEAGAALNILAAFWLFDDKVKELFLRCIPFPNGYKAASFLFPIAVIVLFGLLTIWSGSRIAIFAHVLLSLAVMGKMMWRQEGRQVIFKALLWGAALVVLAFVGYHTQSIAKRSALLFSWENLTLIKKVWARVDVHYIPVGKEQFASRLTDASWMLRIHKWCYSLKLYVMHPQCYLLGIGPGFAMSALDGGFVRLLVEGGLAGLILFVQLLRKTARFSPALLGATAVFSLNMIFFDVYLAYKVMSLYFFLLGATYSDHSSNPDCVKNS